MALNSNALTSIDKLRAWLTQGATSETTGRLAENNLEALINRASSAIEGWCDRVLIAPATDQTYTLDGNGDRRLILPEWPVVSLTSLTIDGQEIAERADLMGLGYIVRSAEAWLNLVGYCFTQGVANVEVVARLGYDAAASATDRRHQRALDDLEQACLLLCRFWFEKPAPGRTTVSAGQQVDRYEPASWPAEVVGLLQPYRRLGA
jgi:hypothetical protein